MAVAIGEKIRAADIDAYNRDYVTKSGSFEGKNLSFSEHAVPAGFAPRTSGDYNIEFNLDGKENGRTDLEVWSADGLTQYIEWDQGDGHPSLNLDNWEHDLVGGNDPRWYLLAPEGDYELRFGIAGSIPRGKVSYWLRQGETGISTGDRIAIRTGTYSGLEAEFANEPKYDFAKVGRFGRRDP